MAGEHVNLGRRNRGNGPGKWGPAKGTREAFGTGHTVTLKHGAVSPRMVEPRAAELADAATRAVPFLADVTFARSVLGWARAEARCDLLAEYLEREGLLDDKGTPRPAADLAARYERLASDARSKLGLDPKSRVALEKDLAQAGLGHARLEAAMGAGRTLRLAAEVDVIDPDEIEWA